MVGMDEAEPPPPSGLGRTWRCLRLYPITSSLICMQVTHQILVLAHLIGFAALLGGVLAQTRHTEPEVTGSMLWGGCAELVTGVALVVLAVVAGGPVNWAPVTVKLVITLFVVLLLVRNRQFLSIPRGLWGLIGVLTLVDAGLAVLWQ
jgi:hypothetical protein